MAGDSRRLERVLLNLLGNANKFAPVGSAIAVTANEDAREVTIAVQDAGPGITAEGIPHLFEQFFTERTSSSRHNIGAGLGLPIAKGIVEAHGGRIWVESRSESARRCRSRCRRPCGRSLMKILVVDDAAEVIEAVTVSFTLQWRETEVIGADNGEAALDLVEQEHPDVVLLDIAMPGMDGFEVLREIRAFSDVPVIMLTAKDDVLDKVKGLELGADDYVTKPFDHLELLARVKALLRRLDMPQPTSRAPSFRAVT